GQVTSVVQNTLKIHTQFSGANHVFLREWNYLCWD
ncbi:unnamed protein product, partial [Linum tenue]